MFPPLPAQRQGLSDASASGSLDPSPAPGLSASASVLTALRVQAPKVTVDVPFDDVFDRCPGGMFVAAMDGAAGGRLVRTNAALTRITGYSGPQLAVMSLADLTHPAELAAHQRWLTEVTDGRPAHLAPRRRWLRADGREIEVRLDASGAGTADAPLLFGMVDDLTDRVPRADRFPEQSAHDPLTGLPDGEWVAGRIAAALRSAERSGRPIAVLHVEVDDLDVSRDVFGAAVGDQLLILAARRLAQNLRPADVLGLGGPSHFVVLCPDFPPTTGDDPAVDTGLARLVDRLGAAMTAPFRIGGIVHHLPFRIGRAASRPGDTVADVRQALASSLAAVPARPGHGSEFRSAPVLLGSVAAARHVDLENELLRAIDEDQLVMFGQPVVTAATGRIGAVEMLIRWRHPVRGLLGPADFLDVAESSPLIEQVGRRVLRESCRIAAGWRLPDDGAPPAVFVNVSGRQLGSGRLRCEVAEALRISGLPAHRLVLELTETQAPLINGTVLADLVQLRADGVRLAIDDVGTGYSTLARLTELPIDLLKVDRVFVAGMQHRRSADAVVRAIVEIGRSLDIPVVAEGVETAEQAAAVRAAGCELVQGFLYARPCPEAELASRLAEGTTLVG